MQIKVAHTPVLLQCLDSRRLPLCLSHHALDLVTKSKGLIAAWPLKKFWFNRCLGKISSFTNSICTGPCSWLSHKIPGTDCSSLVAEVATAAHMLAEHFRKFCSATLLRCYWSRDYVLWGQLALTRARGSQLLASPQYQLLHSQNKGWGLRYAGSSQCCSSSQDFVFAQIQSG